MTVHEGLQVLVHACRRRRGVAWLPLLVAGCVSQGGCMSAERAAQMEAAAAQHSPLTGQSTIDFTLPDQDGRRVSLESERGHWVVLYFYPEDGTPGCECEAREFTQTHERFQQLSARVLGISPDTVASHHQMAHDLKLKVTLLADPDHKVMEAYGAWVWTPFGSRVIRSTVLIDPEGRVAYHWPEVIPEGHADRVRAKLEEVQAAAAKATPMPGMAVR